MAAQPVRLDELIAHVVAEHPAGDVLEQLSEAVVLGGEVSDLADHLIGHFVGRARRAGATWTEIGQSMGVTKQAVQKRFVTNAGGDPKFARFTPRAKSAVVLAEQHARTGHHTQITQLHIVLGLLDETAALAARAIEAQGLDLQTVRTAALAALATAPTSDAVPAHIPFAPGSKRLLERCLREALLLGHNYIGTEHMLLAMFSDDEGEARALLIEAGIDGPAAEQWMVQQLIQPSR